jgi:hypothetical protein
VLDALRAVCHAHVMRISDYTRLTPDLFSYINPSEIGSRGWGLSPNRRTDGTVYYLRPGTRDPRILHPVLRNVFPAEQKRRDVPLTKTHRSLTNNPVKRGHLDPTAGLGRALHWLEARALPGTSDFTQYATQLRGAARSGHHAFTMLHTGRELGVLAAAKETDPDQGRMSWAGRSTAREQLPGFEMPWAVPCDLFIRPGRGDRGTWQERLFLPYGLDIVCAGWFHDGCHPMRSAEPRELYGQLLGMWQYWLPSMLEYHDQEMNLYAETPIRFTPECLGDALDWMLDRRTMRLLPRKGLAGGVERFLPAIYSVALLLGLQTLALWRLATVFPGSEWSELATASPSLPDWLWERCSVKNAHMTRMRCLFPLSRLYEPGDFLRRDGGRILGNRPLLPTPRSDDPWGNRWVWISHVSALDIKCSENATQPLPWAELAEAVNRCNRRNS